MNEWELDKSKHYQITDEEIREFRVNAMSAHNSGLASLATDALTGDAEARDRVARMAKQKNVEALEEIREMSRTLQQYIEQLEYENENADSIAEDALNNGWEKGTHASLTYRAQQLRNNAIEIASQVNDLTKKIERLT